MFLWRPLGNCPVCPPLKSGPARWGPGTPGEGAYKQVVSAIQMHCNSDICENCNVNCAIYIAYLHASLRLSSTHVRGCI